MQAEFPVFSIHVRHAHEYSVPFTRIQLALQFQFCFSNEKKRKWKGESGINKEWI